MLPGNPKEIMPLVLLTQVDHRKTTDCTITNDRAIGLADVYSQPLEEFVNAFPQALIPFLPPWHDFPNQR